jgi:hypothetical protein
VRGAGCSREGAKAGVHGRLEEMGMGFGTVHVSLVPLVACIVYQDHSRWRWGWVGQWVVGG